MRLQVFAVCSLQFAVCSLRLAATPKLSTIWYSSITPCRSCNAIAQGVAEPVLVRNQYQGMGGHAPVTENPVYLRPAADRGVLIQMHMSERIWLACACPTRGGSPIDV